MENTYDEIVAARLQKGVLGVRADIRRNSGVEEDVSPEWLREQFGAITYDRIEHGFNTWVEL